MMSGLIWGIIILQIGEGKTPTAAQLAWYDFDVPEDKIVSARYVRLTFIKGQKTSGKTNWVIHKVVVLAWMNLN